MTERQFQAAIVQLARTAGWRVYHTHDSRRSEAGFPDLVLVHAKRRQLLFMEVKSERGRLSKDQREWLDDLSKATLTAGGVVRPSDWGLVERWLLPQRKRATVAGWEGERER